MNPEKMKPLRVLHVLSAMNHGGVETWLMHVLRNIDREKFQTDFLVQTDQPAVYDSEILALGSKILPCTHTTNPALYGWQFLQVVRRNGPYDVLHSHVHHFSGLVLTLGRIAGIPVRISHSHCITIDHEPKSRLFRRIYLCAMKRLIRTNCTHGFAVSEPAAVALFGQEWRQDRRLSLLCCGIELAPFRVPLDPIAVRAEFGFSREDLIFGHVGSFTPLKNHSFFLEVAARIVTHEPRAKFLLVGEGPLRPEIERRAGVLGLKDRIIFAGRRSDIPRLMIGAMDVFLMPSFHEGLPLVLMESQAAGLPCLVSAEAVPEEAILNPTLVRRLSLDAGPVEWARGASEIAEYPRLDQNCSVEILDASRFDIKRGIQEMCDVYLGHTQ